jgi:peptidoglycan/LPS O-acetylase OafA/YrhL
MCGTFAPPDTRHSAAPAIWPDSKSAGASPATARDAALGSVRRVDPMFGSLRFFLSYLVLLSHLTGSIYATHFGYYAVRAFFVVSGFLITAALNEAYRFDGVRFWTGRLLRLLPLYYLVCLLTLAVVVQLPIEAEQYHFRWHVGDSFAKWGTEWVMNLMVLPLQYAATEFRLVPPYWSIAIELEMYLVLYLIAARNIHCALGLLAVGVAFHVVDSLFGLPWHTRYFTAAGAMMPYAYGALIYFLGQQGWFRVTPRVAALACALWLANMVLAGWLLPESYVYGAGYYLNDVVIAVVVAGLARRPFSGAVTRCDRALGEIAYPVFLSQWLVGFLVAFAFFPGTWRGWMLTLVATPFIIAAGFVLALVNRRLIEPLRLRLRDGPRETPVAAAGAPATG